MRTRNPRSTGLPVLVDTPEDIRDGGVIWAIDYMPKTLCLMRWPGFDPDDFRTELECDEFVQWRLGESPQEHRAMLDRQWMRDREREWRAADQKWLADERDGREKHEKKIFWILVTAAIIALFAALISAGWIPDPNWVED